MSLFNTIRSVLNPDLTHVFEIENRLQDLLATDVVHVDELAEFLDQLDHNTRLAAVRSLGARHLRRLFDAVEGMLRVSIDDLVPAKYGIRNQVRHYGKNSLPAFTIFEKRFLRPSRGASELWGLNHQALAPVTGPGYFMASNASDGRPEVDIDYLRVPPETPEGWPPVQANEAGLNLSRFVYAGMVDRLRGVSQHVSIGRAYRGGKPQPAWFVLCRE